MKKLSVFLIVFLVTLLGANQAVARDPGLRDSLTADNLDAQEESDLLFMREEEKFARDSYITLNNRWNEKIFRNISRSEQRHMDAMLNMLTLYDLPDPVTDNTVGVFTNPDLALLYQQLMDRGDVSLLEAFAVGGFIEEHDIRDLRTAIANTDELPLINAYTNLLAGARNHLRVFVSRYEALGEEYVAQILSQEDVDEIVGDYNMAPPEGFSINPGLNDAWYYPETDGQGFVITVFPGQKTVFLVWFTYDTELPPPDATANLGDPGQRWITAQGGYWGGEADLEVGSMTGGLFDSAEPKPYRVPGGSILLQFEDCNTGSVFYDIPSIGRTGMVPIQRVNSENVALCNGQQGGGAQNGQN